MAYIECQVAELYSEQSLCLEGVELFEAASRTGFLLLYINATIATLMVNLLVYSDLRVAISPVFIAT